MCHRFRRLGCHCFTGTDEEEEDREEESAVPSPPLLANRDLPTHSPGTYVTYLTNQIHDSDWIEHTILQEVLLNITLFYWTLHCFTECHCVLLDITLFYWTLHCFTECHCILLDIIVYWTLHCFTECHCVLLDITLFYWMSLCFTGRYTVLLDVTLFYWMLHCFNFITQRDGSKRESC